MEFFNTSKPFPTGKVVTTVVRGEEIHFYVVNPNDVIQKHHVSGCFYEEEELAIMSGVFPAGGVFVDIGANIGNHSIFISKFLRPGKVIVFEPHPEAIDILRINLLINGLQEEVDRSFLGVGLSDEAGRARVSCHDIDNLGGAHLALDPASGTVPLVEGDSLLRGRAVDLVKVDVEGMELQVLRGLSAVIRESRPYIFVEVDNRNADAFKTWVRDHGYEITTSYRRYAWLENYLLSPQRSSAPSFIVKNGIRERLRIFIWAINKSRALMEHQCEKILKTAEVHGVDVELLGIGHEFVSHDQRMEILRDALKEMGEPERKNTIVVAMDGSDTLINGSSEVIIKKFKRMNTEVLISAEKAYTWQYVGYQQKFDQILTSYPYRYVNAGTFMGYGSSLLNLMNELLHMKAGEWRSVNDQGLLGAWAYHNMDNEHLMKMDLNCDVFWVTCNDWDNLEKASMQADKFIQNNMTGTRPPIIHLTCIGSPQVAEVYDRAYKSILSNAASISG